MTLSWAFVVTMRVFVFDAFPEEFKLGFEHALAVKTGIMNFVNGVGVSSSWSVSD